MTLTCPDCDAFDAPDTPAGHRERVLHLHDEHDPSIGWHDALAEHDAETGVTDA